MLEAELLLIKKLKELERSEIKESLRLKFLAIKEISNEYNYSVKFLCEV